jgi:hypothetical protein
MKKVMIIALFGLVTVLASCGEDGPLKKCTRCSDPSSSQQGDEYCNTAVAVEAYKRTAEAGGLVCTN